MLLLFGSILAAADQPLAVVPSIDLKRYMGKWFEIARLPNRFEKDCASDVTATYTLRADGKIDVLNACKKADGEMKSSKGKARIADKDGPNSKLKVTFFWPFSGDYWILDLDAEYQRVLIGTPNREYLWILSRSPNLDPKTFDALAAKAKSLGFASDRLLRVKHQ